MESFTVDFKMDSKDSPVLTPRFIFSLELLLVRVTNPLLSR